MFKKANFPVKGILALFYKLVPYILTLCVQYFRIISKAGALLLKKNGQLTKMYFYKSGVLVTSALKTCFYRAVFKNHCENYCLNFSLSRFKSCFNPSVNSHFYLNPIMRNSFTPWYNFASSSIK